MPAVDAAARSAETSASEVGSIVDIVAPPTVASTPVGRVDLRLSRQMSIRLPASANLERTRPGSRPGAVGDEPPGATDSTISGIALGPYDCGVAAPVWSRASLAHSGRCAQITVQAQLSSKKPNQTGKGVRLHRRWQFDPGSTAARYGRAMCRFFNRCRTPRSDRCASHRQTVLKRS